MMRNSSAVSRLLEDGWSTIEGTKIHYVSGDVSGGVGRKVLLLHGWGAKIETWGRLPGELVSNGHNVLAVDFPGFGKSDLPPEPWGVKEYTDCLRMLLLELDFLPTDVIAHSFGGRVTLMLAATQPHLVGRLVLVASAGIRIQTTRAKLSALIMRSTRLIFSLPGLNRLQDSVISKLYDRLGSEDYRQSGPLKETFLKIVRQDLREFAAQISAPTLLVWGDLDTQTPIQQANVLNSLIEDSALIVFEGAGHFCYLDQYRRFAIIVLEFLKG